MDWVKLVESLFSVSGIGAIAGLVFNWRKHRKDIKRIEAETRRVKVETDNKLDEIRNRLIDNLQEERDKAVSRASDCFEELEEKKAQVELLNARLSMLHMILIDNGIPIPA